MTNKPEADGMLTLFLQQRSVSWIFKGIKARCVQKINENQTQDF